MNTTLVIMAAGIGSRFGGGIKQLEPVGPNGEIIMDYSIYDAIAAGFNKVVFIIRKDIEKDFKEIIGNRISKVVDVEYVFQSLEDLPAGFVAPEERTKPWGTGQAILCIKDVVHEPFVAINADDYYGKEGFIAIRNYMREHMANESDVLQCCMSGFYVKNTLSENGAVTRGVCKVKENGELLKVEETFDIDWKDGKLRGENSEGEVMEISPDAFVSMNMWGLPPAFLQELQSGFVEFLSGLKEGDIKKEYLLPMVIDRLVREKKAKVNVLKTEDKWFGVTYKEDKEYVVQSIQTLIEQGKYPRKLYE